MSGSLAAPCWPAGPTDSRLLLEHALEALLFADAWVISWSTTSTPAGRPDPSVSCSWATSSCRGIGSPSGPGRTSSVVPASATSAATTSSRRLPSSAVRLVPNSPTAAGFTSTMRPNGSVTRPRPPASRAGAPNAEARSTSRSWKSPDQDPSRQGEGERRQVHLENQPTSKMCRRLATQGTSAAASRMTAIAGSCVKATMLATKSRSPARGPRCCSPRSRRRPVLPSLPASPRSPPTAVRPHQVVGGGEGEQQHRDDRRHGEQGEQAPGHPPVRPVYCSTKVSQPAPGG